VAVAALAWLALGLRSLGLTEDAERVAAIPAPAPAALDEAVSSLEDARFLNPDTRPRLLEGVLLVRAGGARTRDGLALIEDVVEREPENLIAWGVLADATERSDPGRSRAARARMRELSPPVPAR
jgi:cytochrome c-type biogenesis protein CcmH/NrfG